MFYKFEMPAFGLRTRLSDLGSMLSSLQQVKRATGGKGVDAAVELSGHPTGPETGCAITKDHGRYVQVAIVSLRPVHISAPPLSFANLYNLD